MGSRMPLRRVSSSRRWRLGGYLIFATPSEFTALTRRPTPAESACRCITRVMALCHRATIEGTWPAIRRAWLVMSPVLIHHYLGVFNRLRQTSPSKMGPPRLVTVARRASPMTTRHYPNQTSPSKPGLHLVAGTRQTSSLTCRQYIGRPSWFCQTSRFKPDLRLVAGTRPAGSLSLTMTSRQVTGTSGRRPRY
jgi:hypothetical protein